jgi:hypothetical protein
MGPISALEFLPFEKTWFYYLLTLIYPWLVDHSLWFSIPSVNKKVWLFYYSLYRFLISSCRCVLNVARNLLGVFLGMWCLIADISKHFVCSILIGVWIWSVPKHRLLNTTCWRKPQKITCNIYTCCFLFFHILIGDSEIVYGFTLLLCFDCRMLSSALFPSV